MCVPPWQSEATQGGIEPFRTALRVSYDGVRPVPPTPVPLAPPAPPPLWPLSPAPPPEPAPAPPTPPPLWPPNPLPPPEPAPLTPAPPAPAPPNPAEPPVNAGAGSGTTVQPVRSDRTIAILGAPGSRSFTVTKKAPRDTA